MKQISLVVKEKSLNNIVTALENSQFTPRTATKTYDGTTWVTYSREKNSILEIAYASNKKELFLTETFDIDTNINRKQLNIMLGKYTTYKTNKKENEESTLPVYFSGLGAILTFAGFRHPLGMLAGGAIGYYIGNKVQEQKNKKLDRQLIKETNERGFKLGKNAYSYLEKK